MNEMYVINGHDNNERDVKSIMKRDKLVMMIKCNVEIKRIIKKKKKLLFQKKGETAEHFLEKKKFFFFFFHLLIF